MFKQTYVSAHKEETQILRKTIKITVDYFLPWTGGIIWNTLQWLTWYSKQAKIRKILIPIDHKGEGASSISQD